MFLDFLFLKVGFCRMLTLQFQIIKSHVPLSLPRNCSRFFALINPDKQIKNVYKLIAELFQ
jgi:hypothetical protein